MLLNVECLGKAVDEKKLLVSELETSYNYLTEKNKECEIMKKALAELRVANNLKTLANTLESNSQRLSLKGAKVHKDSTKEINHVLAKAASAIVDFSDRVNAMQNLDDAAKMRDLTEELKIELELAVCHQDEHDVLAQRICNLAIRDSSLKASVSK
jgi:hypothetical protein